MRLARRWSVVLSGTGITLAILLSVGLPPPVLAAEISYVIVVNEKKQPLEAVAELIPADTSKKPVLLGETTLPKGELILHPPVQCGQGAQLYIFVAAGNYLGQKAQCGKNPVSVTLTSWTTLEAEFRIFRDAEQQKQYGVAALVSNDASARLNAAPTVELRRTLALINGGSGATETAAQQALLKSALQTELTARGNSDEAAHKGTAVETTWVSVGRILDMSTPTTFDPERAQFVMRPTTREALLRYQTEHGLKPTGQLNYSTLSHFAGGDIADILDKKGM